MQERAPRAKRQKDPLIGTVLHGYRIEAPLGIGAMARVYRARHEVLGRSAALKLLRTGVDDNPISMARLRREASALSTIRHPNVVSVVDVGVTDSGDPFLMTELIEGRTLKDVILAEAPLRVERTLRIARQIAEGLGAAHDNGVVHRDLKPANVMITGTGPAERVKLLDFGVARVVDESATRLTQIETLLGTPLYMAPEQITGASDVGPPADLYSLGVILFTMLAGTPPFIARSSREVLTMHLEVPAPRLAPSGGFEAIVARLLEKDPARRIQSAAELIRLLDEIDLEGLAATALHPLTQVTWVDPRLSASANLAGRLEPWMLGGSMPESGSEPHEPTQPRVMSGFDLASVGAIPAAPKGRLWPIVVPTVISAFALAFAIAAYFAVPRGKTPRPASPPARSAGALSPSPTGDR